MNPSTDLARVVSDPKARLRIYAGYVVLVLATGAATAAFVAIEAGIPPWLVAANAVVGYLSVPVVGLSALNTPERPVEPQETVSEPPAAPREPLID